MLLHDIRAPDTRDDAALLALNNAHAIETSLLDAAKLRHLLAEAFHATAIISANRIDALLIAVDHTATYDSPNFVWFQSRLQRFVYVDRVIVSANARGQGLARRLYGDLFTATLHANVSAVVCEVNLDPPNPASDAFHAALGFTELGRATLANGKTVRYLSHSLMTPAD